PHIGAGLPGIRVPLIPGYAAGASPIRMRARSERSHSGFVKREWRPGVRLRLNPSHAARPKADSPGQPGNQSPRRRSICSCPRAVPVVFGALFLLYFSRFRPQINKMRPLRSLARIALPFALVSTTAATTLPAGIQQGATVEGVTEYALPNGLRVLLVPDATQPKTTVNVTYLVGSHQENYGETGMAHLLEHLMFK